MTFARAATPDPGRRRTSTTSGARRGAAAVYARTSSTSGARRGAAAVYARTSSAANADSVRHTKLRAGLATVTHDPPAHAAAPPRLALTCALSPSCYLPVPSAVPCQASRPRQHSVAEAQAASAGDVVVAKVAEVISGSLPPASRKCLRELIASGKFNKIYVESSRAIARSALAAEELYNMSVQHDVKIIPSDMPDLYAHDATAVQKFLRRVIFAVTELDRDMTVEKLQDGLRRKRALTKRRTQRGEPKANGTLSLLERLKPSSAVLRRLRSAVARHEREPNFGLRSLAAALSDVLALPSQMSHETARRLALSLAPPPPS